MKKSLIALALIMPAANSLKASSYEKYLLCTGYSILVAAPIAYGIHHYWTKRKLSQRPVAQVKNDAELYLNNTKKDYKVLTDLLSKIETTSSDLEKRVYSQDFIKQAHIMNATSRYSLITFTEKVKAVEDELNLHKKWLDERLKLLENQNSSFINILSSLKHEIEEYLKKNDTMYSNVIISFEYQQQKLMREAEARASASRPAIYY